MSFFLNISSATFLGNPYLIEEVFNFYDEKQENILMIENIKDFLLLVKDFQVYIIDISRNKSKYFKDLKIILLSFEEVLELLEKDKEIFYDKYISYNFLETFKENSKEKKELKLFDYQEINLSEKEISLIKENYEIIEMSFIYGYSLLREGIESQEIEREIMDYLLLKTNNRLKSEVKVNFIRFNEERKEGLTKLLKEDSIVVIQIKGEKLFLSVKTIYFGYKVPRIFQEIYEKISKKSFELVEIIKEEKKKEKNYCKGSDLLEEMNEGIKESNEKVEIFCKNDWLSFSYEEVKRDSKINIKSKKAISFLVSFGFKFEKEKVMDIIISVSLLIKGDNKCDRIDPFCKELIQIF